MLPHTLKLDTVPEWITHTPEMLHT